MKLPGVEIRKYNKADEAALMALITDQGEEWSCYSAPGFREKYKNALADSITYVAYVDGGIAGFSRSLNDGSFYIYVCDLLVAPRFRGRSIGRKLMECLYEAFPGRTVYVMSDADGYYEKQGYPREGSVFQVKAPE